MSLKEWTKALKERVKQPGGLFGSGADTAMESNMANGGFSGYRPGKAAKNDTQSVPQMPPEGMGYEPVAAPTGFTGMYPPTPDMTGIYQQPYGQPMEGTSTYHQPAWNATGAYQQPAQPVWQTSQFTQQGGMGNTQRNQPMGNTGYQAAGQAPYQQPSMPGTGRYQPAGSSQQPQDNIRYMPNTFVGDDGRAYNHVERVAQLVSVSACYRIIEFMRNGESVILNTESIASDGEIQRCMDMLSGAAFTLGCSITKITQVKRAYLIAPATVLVMPDMVFQRMSDRESAWKPEAEESRRNERGYRASGDYSWSQDGAARQETQDYGQQRDSASRAQDTTRHGDYTQWRKSGFSGYAQSPASYDAPTAPQEFGGFGGFGSTGIGR